MSAEARSRPALAAGGTVERTVAVAAGAAAAAAALGALAVYSPKDALEVVLAAALVAVVAWRLPVAVAIFAVLTFPEHLPGSLGVGATLAKPVGAVIFGGWALLVIRRRGAPGLLPRERPGLFAVVVAFLALAAASALWAASTGRVSYELGRLLQVAALLVVTYTAASTHRGFRAIVWGFLAGSAITSVYSVASGNYASNGRLGVLFDPNFFAAELIPAIVVSIFVLVSAESARVRAAAAAVAVVDMLAFALTQSRGGIVGMSVALAAAVVVAGRARPRIVAVVLVVIAAGLSYYAIYRPAHVAGSFSTGLSGASSGRSDEWRIALRMLGRHPAGGVGLGNYPVAEPSYATSTLNLNYVRLVVTDRLAAHNSYLEVAAELGIAGLVLFLAVLWLTLRAAGRSLHLLADALDPHEFVARGLVAGSLGMFVAYVFLSGQYEKQLWLVLGLLAAVPALLRWRRR